MIFRIAGPVGALVLSACTVSTPATRSISLADGAIIARTPDGYCVDENISIAADGFAVLAPCATLGVEAPPPALVGVATVQVGAPESGSVDGTEAALRDFLITDAGTALLSASGQSENVEILSMQAFGNQVMVYFDDQGPQSVAGLQREEWRAFTDVGGRLVTIAVRGLAAAPLGEGPGATLLKRVLAGISATTEI
ncbi:MAG: dihydroxy-acid dehydratase [Pseudomonadota bacterium]